MNVCFVSNFNKTYFFHEIAKSLELKGIAIHWIVVNRRLHSFLLQHYPSDRILLINKENASVPEEPMGDFRLNELIYGDRVLRHEPFWAKDYLRNIQRPFIEFLKAHSIRFIFGEMTWAHEVLFHRLVCHYATLGARYLCPHTIRIPTGRFAFFADEYQSEFYECPDQHMSIESEIDFCVSKPDYLAINDQRLQASRSIGARLTRVRHYLTRKNIDPFDPCVTANRWLSFKLRAAEELNRELYHLVPKRKLDSSLASKPYIFIALHKQPEASIDVIGRYYEDQYRNILNIWRTLPDGWLILVKEHTNAIGDRPISFYRQISKLPDTVLVSEQVDSYDLIKNSQLVVTVSGTVAYEAALMNRRSVTFAPCFFNKLDGCTKIDLETLRRCGVLIKHRHKKISEQKEYILRNSFPGVISDPISNARCTEEGNIRLVTNAFISVITGGR